MVNIDPYEAMAHGIDYESWRFVMDNDTLDPRMCESQGIPFEDWRVLCQLNKE